MRMIWVALALVSCGGSNGNSESIGNGTYASDCMTACAAPSSCTGKLIGSVDECAAACAAYTEGLPPTLASCTTAPNTAWDTPSCHLSLDSVYDCGPDTTNAQLAAIGVPDNASDVYAFKCKELCTLKSYNSSSPACVVGATMAQSQADCETTCEQKFAGKTLLCVECLYDLGFYADETSGGPCTLVFDGDCSTSCN